MNGDLNNLTLYKNTLIVSIEDMELGKEIVVFSQGDLILLASALLYLYGKNPTVTGFINLLNVGMSNKQIKDVLDETGVDPEQN